MGKRYLAMGKRYLSSGKWAGRIKYQARHYSVTPLGPRSGLIQWVDGATPLFGLYKRWQQREAVAQVLRAQANASAPSQLTPTVPRPSEIYYNKLTPALKEKGVTNLENRREWPLETMTSVLRELMAETPADLLAKILHHTLQQRAQKRGSFALTMDQISTKLSNLKVTAIPMPGLNTTQQAVHIDYNVCFEKGRSLRVPEKVPFRMSQNIETALGVTGIEGVFRNSCEHVLRVMRRGRETLLTLLEAFVYDPLVDWTTGNDAGYAGAFYGGGPVAAATDGKQSKRVMEREITFSMFSIRVAEMRTAWLKNRDEMETALPRLSDLVQDQLSTQQSCEKLSCQVAALKQQTLMLEEACADKGSALYTLAERYSGYAVVLGAEKSARAAFQEKLTEWEQWHQLHKCEQCESELSQLVHQRRVLLRSCMEQMHTYCTVVAQYPPAYLQINRVARWSHWLRQLLDDWTQSRCQQVVSEFHRHYGDAMQALSTSQSMLAIELKLSSVIADTNTKLLKLAERHNQEAVNPDHLQQAVEETSANITKFVQENRTSGSVSLASVIITALCALNKRYLVMEGAAAAAGDRLMDLTSRDGDWFLDELCSMSANVCQLVALLQQHYSLAATGGALEELAQRATVVTRGTHHVYLALQDLNTNFRKIILPEACKRIQSEEPSVAVAVATLNRLVHDAGMPLDSLLGHMDTKMRNIIMGIGQVDSETAPVVDALKRGFAALLRGDGGATVTAEMTAGQMLLMGFNGLFTRLSDVHAEVAAAFTELEPPPLWRKIDVVREARGLQMCVFGEEILSLLEDIFFIKKLQAMREFFDICCKLANTLYGDRAAVVIGLPSQVLGHLLCVYMHALGVDVSAEIELKDIGAESKVAIEDLCKKAVEAGLREGRVQHTDLTQASTLTSTHDTVWRKQDLVRRLGTSMMLLQSSMATAKMQLTRFQWLHEDALTQAHGGQLKTTPSRSTVMSDMRKEAGTSIECCCSRSRQRRDALTDHCQWLHRTRLTQGSRRPLNTTPSRSRGPSVRHAQCVQVVLTLEPAIAGVQEKYAQQEASISQRLRWAAGANQSLQATLDKFEQASRDRTDFLLVESKIAVDISNLCNSVLHCEALRTRTPEAINGDRNFVVLINRCQESYVLKDNCSDSVSPLEASLVESGPCGTAPVMLEWVQTALACVVTATTRGGGGGRARAGAGALARARPCAGHDDDDLATCWRRHTS
ncbi:PREDICTED: serine/threonine-protein kinase SMG1-like [Priapulus caudatus]|uniref:Serine/threonine-protein kinase SMG1-like n=1 Tax=Priapulus caudatus TaxID=37621 RepID=A0ABM1EW85_PRICU|nr:PREDICTED: serine/threonine-protein kinase SMG1-like [Priapulus caudatus]